MKTRCAPIRDSVIDMALTRLDEGSTIGTTETLARIVVETVKFILNFADTMKSDMTQFVMGQLSEKELNEAATSYALESEKSIIMQMWGKENVESGWKTWLDQGQVDTDRTDSRPRWLSRLLNCLEVDEAVSCDLSNTIFLLHAKTEDLTFSESAIKNILPAPFLFVAPALLRIQNILQVLVAAALLRILVPSPTRANDMIPSSDSSQSEADEGSFMHRIWSLLIGVIETSPESNTTKLLNLADEVIRERRRQVFSSTISITEDDDKIRLSVGRLLNSKDPAFKLLHKRLVSTVSAHISLSPIHPDIPFVMRTGNARKSPFISGRPNDADDALSSLRIKGFEDHLLIEEIKHVINDLQFTILWVKRTWAGTLNDI